MARLELCLQRRCLICVQRSDEGDSTLTVASRSYWSCRKICALIPEVAMLMQKPVAVDNHSFDVLQRAFDGACWSVGIPRCARRGEMKEITETRKTIALTVLWCAAAGARDVQVLKASALRSLFSRGRAPLLAHQLG